MTGFNTSEAFSAARASARGIKGDILPLSERKPGIYLCLISSAVFSPQQGAKKWAKVGNFARQSLS
jgi:hypothetical protein